MSIFVIGSVAFVLQAWLVFALARHMLGEADERRRRDEWARQFARGLTSKRYDEWKLSQGRNPQPEGGDA